jgi:hypothetical protein
MIAVRNIVEGSNLSEQEKRDLLNKIAALPVVVENIAIQRWIGSGALLKDWWTWLTNLKLGRCISKASPTVSTRRRPPGASSFM